MSADAAMPPWLSLIGLGEDGIEGLSSAARQALAQAELIVGGARHLALVPASGQERLCWPSPLTDAFPAILARRGRPVAVLASGDPFHYGVGTTLAAQMSVAEMRSFPGRSAFTLAANRLGWAEQDTALISLHGRPLERLLPCLAADAHILALSWDATTPAKVAALLVARGCGGTVITVLEALGGPRERIRRQTAEAFDLTDIDPLNIIALEVAGTPNAHFLPLTPGLPDDWFEHDGQITKRDIRAVTLAALAPRRGELLWDVGAGSGSIGIEWMLADAVNRAVAIEPRAERVARIARNARALGVPDLRVVAGAAPTALADLPVPDAVFLGGGGTGDGVLETVWRALKPHGRLVANAVTLETQAAILAWRGRYGGDLVQIAVAEAEPIGGFTGWKPARPIVQWRVEKPHE